MDYQRHYNSLIITRKNRPTSHDQYYEKHHIKNKISVVQLSKDIVYINTFTSINEAVRLTGIPKSSIQGCVAGTLDHAGGYLWKKNNNNNI